MKTLSIITTFLFANTLVAQTASDLAKFIEQNYTKSSHDIAVRDGVKLRTIVYSPRDASRRYPILLNRTPYSIGPYEADKFRASLGPSSLFVHEGYIFAYQDVRGRYMSEGEFENVRPQLASRKSPSDIDESTDTYDTIDWLVKNVPNHNGRVGMYGISYPGFYAAVGMIEAHPALKAVSPQAPVTDWFFDDFYHHGAFFMTHAFNFFSSFGQPRPKPTAEKLKGFEYPTNDGYQFWLDVGPLKNVPKKFSAEVAYWKKLETHNTYDAFWKARDIRPHLKKVAPAVMTVGGWFDAEDLFGPLKTYASVEKQNPGIFNILVMGPWTHGGWSRSESKLGDISWGHDTSRYYQHNIELPFFNHHLKDKGPNELTEAIVFETGTNVWRYLPSWPPAAVEKKSLHFHPEGKLEWNSVQDSGDAHDAFLSDPRKPVPYTGKTTTIMMPEYMTEDQRFASRRPDVLVYQTAVLPEKVTLAGPLLADLHVSITGEDADWVVKVIDVYPTDLKDANGQHAALAGYQMMVRSDVIRGRFRNHYDKPAPFVSNEPTRVKLELQDVLHTFPKGHRIMVQICSSWFPLIDRNPQKYVANIFEAKDADFVPATHRVYRTKDRPSRVEVGVLR